MIISLYAFRDIKVGSYGPVQMFQNDSVLKRTMSEHLSSGRGDDLSKYPHDFDCYYLGSYNDESGALVAAESPALVFNCGIFLEEIKKQD